MAQLLRVYKRPVLTYFVGTVIAMYFDPTKASLRIDETSFLKLVNDSHCMGDFNTSPLKHRDIFSPQGNFKFTYIRFLPVFRTKTKQVPTRKIPSKQSSNLPSFSLPPFPLLRRLVVSPPPPPPPPALRSTEVRTTTVSWSSGVH